jgi:hypothetical protein
LLGIGFDAPDLNIPYWGKPDAVVVVSDKLSFHLENFDGPDLLEVIADFQALLVCVIGVFATLNKTEIVLHLFITVVLDAFKIRSEGGLKVCQRQRFAHAVCIANHGLNKLNCALWLVFVAPISEQFRAPDFVEAEHVGLLPRPHVLLYVVERVAVDCLEARDFGVARQSVPD